MISKLTGTRCRVVITFRREDVEEFFAYDDFELDYFDRNSHRLPVLAARE